MVKKLCTVYINKKEQMVLLVYPDGGIVIMSMDDWKNGVTPLC